MPTKRVGRSVTAAATTTKKSSKRKTAAAKGPADRIMPAPKGARTLTHRQIEETVKKVFERRTIADA